jgi:DNA-binding PadR family transcriptional regulator
MGPFFSLLEPNFIEDVEGRTKEIIWLIILDVIKRGNNYAGLIYEKLREFGIPMNLSTFYATLRELEKEGLLRSEGTRNKKYFVTEKGEEYLKINSKKLDEITTAFKRLKIAQTMGIQTIIITLKELITKVEELSPEERAEIAEALGITFAKIRKVLSRHI